MQTQTTNGMIQPRTCGRRTRRRTEFSFAFHAMLCLASSLLLAPGTASAATITKADNTTALNQAASWVSGGPPGSGDIALINNTLTANRTANLGASMSWNGIQVANPNGILVLGPTTGATLTLGTGGIDMSSATANLGIGCLVALGANNTWDVASGRTLSVTNVVSGSSSLTKSGPGTLVLNRANTFTGDVLISAGTVTATGGTGFGGVFGQAGTITIASGATLNNATGNNGPFGNPAGSGTEGTPATLRPGNVIIHAGGLLTIGSGVTAHIPRVLVLSGGELSSSGTVNATFGSWNLEQGVVVSNSTVTSTISALGVVPNQQGGTVFDVVGGASNGIDLDVTGYIGFFSGLKDNGIIKKGAGVMRLSGVNTYTNITRINEGTLLLNGSGSLAASAQILVADGATFDVSGVSFTLGSGKVLGGSGVVTGDVAVANGGIVKPGSTAGTLSFSGDLSLSDATILFDLSDDPVAGVNDRVAVSGNLSLSGVTTIQIDYTALGEGRYKLFTYDGALTGSTANLVLGGFIASGRQTAFLDDSVANEIALVVGGSGANLNWVGDGSANNWDANTSQNWLNTGTAGADYFFNGDFVTFDDSGSKTPDVNLAGSLEPGSLLVNNDAGTYTFSGTGKITGSTALTKQGEGTLVIANSGNNDFSGGVIIDAGTLQVGNGGTSGSLPAGGTITNSATLVFNRSGSLTVPNVISGDGALIKEGDGTLTLTGVNTFTGKTAINGGTLTAAGADSRLGAAPDSMSSDQITIDNGGKLMLGSASYTVATNRGITIGPGGGSLGCVGSFTVTIPGPISGTGNLTNAGTTATATIRITNPTNSFAGDVYFVPGAGLWNVDSAGQFGTGTLRWHGGGFTIQNDRGTIENYIANPIDMAGDLLLRANNVTDAGTRNVVFSTDSITTTGGTLTITDLVTSPANHVFAVRFHGAGFDFSRPIVMTPTGSTMTYLTFGNSNATTQTFSGIISGAGRVRRTAVNPADAGTTILTAENTYSAGTFVDAGTLLVNNTSGSGTGSGDVTVEDSGTLGGTGALTGNVILNSGGTIAPGAGVGALTTGSQTWKGGASYEWEINDADGSAGTGWDTLNVIGDITVQATGANPFSIRLRSLSGGAPGNAANFDNTSSDTWPIASVSGSVADFDAQKFVIDDSSFSNDLAGGTFALENAPLSIRFISNRAPVALATNYTRAAGTMMKINLADLLANRTSDPDGHARSFHAFQSAAGAMKSANGHTVTINDTYLFYTNTADNVTDTIDYVIVDAAPYRAGDTRRYATNTITIATVNATGQAQAIAVENGTATLRFAGIPGYAYAIQRSTNLVDWVTLVTTNAPVGGVFQWADDFGDVGGEPPASAFYRLQQP